MTGRTVLWGARRGDVVYGSRDWRRTHIPIGDAVLQVASNAYFDVWATVEMRPFGETVYEVTGKEGAVAVGVRPVPRR